MTGVGPVLTMHLGPDDVLLNIEVTFTPGLRAEEIHEAVHRIEERINGPYPEVSRIFIEVEALARRAAGVTPPDASHERRPHTTEDGGAMKRALAPLAIGCGLVGVVAIVVAGRGVELGLVRARQRRARRRCS